MSLTNPTLANFVKNLPIVDKVTALQALVLYDTRNGQFDDFIYTIMPLVSFNPMVTPFSVLIGMISLQDGTPNVSRFVQDALKYIPTLISVPSLFCENYNENILFEEFVGFLHTNHANSDYVKYIINMSIQNEPSTCDFFSRVLNNFAYRFTQARLFDCLDYLTSFINILGVNQVRHAFVEAPHFYQIMTCLFQKSIFPGDSLGDFTEFFGNDPPKTIQNNKIHSLNTILSTYHQKLATIIRLCLFSETKLKTFEYIRSMLHQIQVNVSDIRFLMTSYNFEGALIHLAFIVQQKWLNSNPLTPYMPNSLAPMGDEPELALPGRESWVDAQNTANVSSFHNLMDDYDPAQLEQEKIQWEQIKANLHEEPDAASQFFFSTLKALDLVSSNFIEVITSLNRRIFFSIEPAIQEHPTPELFKEKKVLEDLIFCLSFLLNIEFKSSKTIELITYTLSYLQLTAQYDEINRQLPPNPPIAYQRLPEYILATVAKLVNFYNRQGMIREPFPLIRLFSILFSNLKYVRNPTIGHNIVSFFSDIAENKQNCYLIVANTVIELMYPAVVQFYSRLQMTGTHSEYYDKQNMRPSCVKLITFWLEHQECREYFQKNYNKDANRQFLFYLIEDTTFYVSNCLNAFIQIQEMKKNNENQESMQSIRHELENDFIRSKLWMKLLVSIAQFAPFAFKDDSIVMKFPQFVLFVLQKASEPNGLYIDNPEEIKYDPNYFLTAFANLASLLTYDQEVVSTFANENIGYRNGLIDSVLAALNRLPRTQEYEDVTRRFSVFADLLKNIAAQNASIEINIDDAPEEFIDPILYVLMTDPYRLPTGTVIDKSTLDQVIMNGLKDPLTTVIFKLEDVKPDTELKKRIDEWVAQQKKK
ncbi:hypothetical protein TRFO_40351 [Tritrichomonas foetus]|uniref:U-box domain-containing protein n=1 Tax=Tritrichomonas foetus TaxID=1144522 RepID=A0A1J4J7Z7_9EUKA|nr:hypothetical protein TRFO_40351 [Tritrichomonas foetus]|eukprot:OHS93356.1 hypothetical protein TRFO_40351 [Tritrichomonas foetus]